MKAWKVAPRIVVGEQEKRAAFRIARAALAKSGTVTLELALAGVPMVAAYRAGAVEAWIVLRAINVKSVILANLVVGENVVPEFLQEDCTADKLSRALREMLGILPLRRAPARGLCADRRDHVDGQPAAERPRRRHRAGDAAKVARAGANYKACFAAFRTGMGKKSSRCRTALAIRTDSTSEASDYFRLSMST